MALGWYVHYRYKNYQNWGINYKFEDKSANYNRLVEAHQTQRKRYYSQVLQSHSDQDLKALETLLNSYIRDQDVSKNNGYSPTVSPFIRNLVQEYLQDKLEAGLKLDKKTMNVRRATPVHKVTNLDVQAIIQEKYNLEQTILRGKKGLTKEQIKAWNKEYSAKLRGFNASLKNYIEQAVNFWNSRNEGQITVEQIMKDAESGIKNKAFHNLMVYSNKFDKGNQKIASLKDRFNALIACIQSLPLPDPNNAKGEAFQKLIALVPNTVMTEADVIAGRSSQEVFQDISRRGVIRGTQVLNVKFDPSKILPEAMENLSEYAFSTDTIDGRITPVLEGGQGKVDVEIVWRGKTLKISAKNINPYAIINGRPAGIALESSVMRNLIYHLQDDEVFGNHVLNLMAMHPSDHDSAGAMDRANMLHELTLTILFNALTGSGYGVEANNIADVFIMNDNTQGKIRVFSMQELISLLEQKASALKDIPVFANETPIQYLKLHNTWVSIPSGEKGDIAMLNEKYARIRIGKLMQEAASKKLSAYISGDFVWNQMGFKT